MRKFIAITLPIVVILCFILIMTGASYLKQPTGENDNILGIINDIKYDINNENWDSAKGKTDKLNKGWNIISKRVQFSAERDELTEAQTSIARLKGYIEAQDKPGAFAELSEVKEHWIDIGK